MKVLILVAMVLGCGAAYADVFKCVNKAGKTVYQEKPCDASAKVQQLDIKSDPAKEAEAKAKLEALQTEIDARRAERQQAEKEAAEKRFQNQQVDALRRSAAAQQQQAVAEQRQAEALEKQNQQITSPVWVLPGYGARPPYSNQPGSSGTRHDLDTGRDTKKPGREGDGGAGPGVDQPKR